MIAQVVTMSGTLAAFIIGGSIVLLAVALCMEARR